MAARKVRMRILVLILIAAIFCTACQSKNPQDTIQMPTEASGESTDSLQETRPTLIVGSTKAKAGDEGVEVMVQILRNPGILGMDFDIYYDETVMTLTDAQSELQVEGYVYTPPAYYRNPTTFLWDSQDANWTSDGVFLTLRFDIAEDAPAGNYEVKLMYSYGNIFDGNLESIDVAVRNSNISIGE